MSETKQEVEIGIDVGRVLFGLSRIGYTTSSAICDIIDNSVRAKAKNIHIFIEKERKDYSNTKKNNVKEYIIVDDGDGMDANGIEEALKLGSDGTGYENGTLAKFGLGLKSASFSQSEVLQVISSDGNGFNKYQVSLPDVIRRKDYFATKEELDEVDNGIIKDYLTNNKGTIIRLAQVRKVNHPSVKKTIEELKLKVGVIYYYYLTDEDLSIKIGGENIKAVDPLFVSEADENGNLNENDWDGQSVKWIYKTKEIPLDEESRVSVQLEMTQLPYPPIFNLSQGKGADKKIRQKYNIGAPHYGFYVYRNKRLISWASKLDGIIPTDQDYYAFRGRILIDDSADDFFNIDVKKSTLHLSEDTSSIISDISQEAKRKSKLAWQAAYRAKNALAKKPVDEYTNEILDDYEGTESLPGDSISEEEALKRKELLETEMAEKANIIAKNALEDEGNEVEEGRVFTPEEKEKAIKGEANSLLSKVFPVNSIIDNYLWEPYFDPEKEHCVRINKMHRFARLIYIENQDNKDLHTLFNLLLFQFSDAELYARRNIDKYSYEELSKILEEFRRIASETLANMCRKLDGKLPPNYSEEYD